MPNLNIESREPVATLRDVTVTYDGYQTRALARVNLEVRRGEVLGVLGVKGAGKSTLLKILAGRLAPTEGKAKAFGRSSRGGTAKARVGYSPGSADAARPRGFFERMFGGRKESAVSVRGVGRLTQAMVGGRDLLVLDDPFEGLNAAETIEAAKLVQEMASRGKTVVLSSDSLLEVRDLCNRFVVLHEGRVQAVGALAELLGASGAIRFLPAVLPREIVERVLGVLREEIAKGTTAGATVQSTTQKTETRPESGQNLTQSAARPAASAGDSIDHGKLEELTKPTPPK